ncbi:MAG TPA: hypothetical protein EYH30_05190 [Anaerolineales bacterium]|nr:hypothetical protein [Anaerolineae bacterium]HIQ01507.1 hypothetical protein [Anaerolineales bacterium]
MLDFLLSHPIIARIRRNHALEHATIHLLSQRHRNLRVVGRSTLSGFTLYGDLPTEAVLEAAQEALARLKAGQQELAVHPTCGTNFVAGGTLAGVGAFAVLTPRRRSPIEWLGRLPLVLLVSTLGFILGQRLGAVLQARVTTDPQVGNLRIVGVAREERGPLVLHYVRTEG